MELGTLRRGWQHEAVSRVERRHHSGAPLADAPSNCSTRIDADLFRVLLLRRFRLPLPPISSTCRCGHLSHFGSSHFSQTGCDAVCLVQEVSFVFCVFESRGCMPRKGWSSLPVPDGWFEVIPGPRPPSVQ